MCVTTYTFLLTGVTLSITSNSVSYRHYDGYGRKFRGRGGEGWTYWNPFDEVERLGVKEIDSVPRRNELT